MIFALRRAAAAMPPGSLVIFATSDVETAGLIMKKTEPRIQVA